MNQCTDSIITGWFYMCSLFLFRTCVFNLLFGNAFVMDGAFSFLVPVGFCIEISFSKAIMIINFKVYYTMDYYHYHCYQSLIPFIGASSLSIIF